MALRATTLVTLTALAGFSVACGGTKAGDSQEGAGGQGGEGGAAAKSSFAPGVADPCKNGPHTSYANDENCLEAPPADVGFQMHFGPPAGSDYDDPNVLAPYVLKVGDEGVLCQAVTTGNADLAYSHEQHIRTRTGTHHIIFWRAVQPVANPPADGDLVKDNCRFGTHAFFVGTEAGLGPNGGTLDVPLPGATSAYGPEDSGIAESIQAKTPVWIETHFVNTSDQDMLREAWANIIYTDPSKVTTVMDPIFWIGGYGMKVPAHTDQVVTAGPATLDGIKNMPAGGGPVRLMGIAGHVHAHDQRESIYLNHAGGGKDLIYETYHWSESLFAQFDSTHQNPAVGTNGTDGAISGKLILNPGDTITWECDINNTLDTALQFADRAYDAEMCNVFGYYIPGSGTMWSAFSL